MQCVYGVGGSKNITFHILYIIVAPLCSALLKRVDFYKAHRSEKARCALIGQQSSALWLAEYHKHVTEILRPLPCGDAVSRRDETKTIKPTINEAFVAFSEDIITDYNESVIMSSLNATNASFIVDIITNYNESYIIFKCCRAV